MMDLARSSNKDWGSAGAIGDSSTGNRLAAGPVKVTGAQVRPIAVGQKFGMRRCTNGCGAETEEVDLDDGQC